jgi:hypothetical protein
LRVLGVPELCEYLPTEPIPILRRIVESGVELAEPVACGRSDRPIGERAERK